jgi:hypothetical protein
VAATKASRRSTSVPGRGVPVGQHVDHRGQVPPGVVLEAGQRAVGGEELVGPLRAEVGGEVHAHVAEIERGRPPGGEVPVDHADQPATRPQGVARVVVAVDEARLARWRRAVGRLDRPGPQALAARPGRRDQRLGVVEALIGRQRRGADAGASRVDGRERGRQPVDQAPRVGRHVGRAAREPGEQQGGHVAGGAVRVGRDQPRRRHRRGRQQLQHGRLAGGGEGGVVHLPAGSRPPPQHQPVHPAGRVGHVDGMVGEPTRGQQPDPHDPAASADRRGRPSQRRRRRAAAEEPADPVGLHHARNLAAHTLDIYAERGDRPGQGQAVRAR